MSTHAGAACRCASTLRHLEPRSLVVSARSLSWGRSGQESPSSLLSLHILQRRVLKVAVNQNSHCRSRASCARAWTWLQLLTVCARSPSCCGARDGGCWPVVALDGHCALALVANDVDVSAVVRALVYLQPVREHVLVKPLDVDTRDSHRYTANTQAVTKAIGPYIKTSMVSLYMGSFQHGMARSRSKFNRVLC